MPADIALPIQPVMGTQRVWTRAKWSDPWTPRPGLRCTQFRKCTIPQVGTATLHWIAGRVSLPGEYTSQYREPLSIAHDFVKIEYQPYEEGALPITWYGTVEEVHEKRGDRLKLPDESIVAGKKQTFTCHELTLLLARTPILDGWFNDNGVAKKLGLAPVFNEGGIGNRATNMVDGVYPFTAGEIAKPPFWSSADIVNYLLKHHQPKNGQGQPIFAFNNPGLGLGGGLSSGIELHAPSAVLVHTWDQPIFDPHGKDLKMVLGMLFDQRAGMGAFLDVQKESVANPFGGGPVEVEKVVLRPFTYADEVVSLSLDGTKNIRANLNQFNLLTDGQPGLMVDLKETHSDVYSQVVCQGARRLAVGTFSNGDATWAHNWSDDSKTKYNAGASTAADYAALTDDDDKRRRNADVRNSDELIDVYSRFGISGNWDGKVKGGNDGEAKPLLVDDDQSDNVFGNWWWDRNIQPALPMKEGEDYSDLKNVTQNWSGQVEYRRPMVFMEYKDAAGKWFQVDVGGLAKTKSGDNRKWSCSVHAERKSGINQFGPTMRLTTNGQPQHVLASAEFVALPVDEAIVKYDWKKMLVTLAIEEARYCEARWPKKVPLPVRAVRVKVIQCGDGFQKNYLAPNTVIGLDATNGDLKRNTSGGFIRDDEKKLEEIARAMYEFYSKPRTSMGITKRGATARLGLGDLIHQLGAVTDPSELTQVVNSVVTEIAIHLPEGGGVPTQIWTTNRGELDHVPIRMAGK